MSKQKESKVDYRTIGAFLEERVRRFGSDAPIYYGDLAAHFAMPPVTGAWFTHPLCAIVGEIDVEDVRLGQPFRTVLVISKERNMPGEGFFKAYLDLNPHVRVPKTDNDKMKLFVGELNNVLAYYGKTAH